MFINGKLYNSEENFDELFIIDVNDSTSVGIEQLEVGSDILQQYTDANEVVESDFVTGLRGESGHDKIVETIRQSVTKV